MLLNCGVGEEGNPGGLQSMGSQRVDMTEVLNSNNNYVSSSRHSVHLIPYLLSSLLLMISAPIQEEKSSNGGVSVLTIMIIICNQLNVKVGLLWCLRRQRIYLQYGRPGFDLQLGNIP